MGQFDPLQEVAGQYLTAPAKRRELATWERLKAAGGDRVGCPDPAIYPLCDRLNAIPDVCTLQSCAGHIRNGYYESGHLWLWLSQSLSRRFDRTALALAKRQGIDRVERIYTGWGQEITSLTFAGEERGLLAASSTVIAEFFESLC
jgi:hypothetical protein